ncbi:hypothetical protein DFH08DRAFT_869572 [Mycena albidolilacea]|uniref:Uncharacterized protein n=1 Tax=Mycena albidolilacea TaxID=1033008 RepID=A0AAD7A004_9AGAR|nr:hypothetical protein DFH08DRAFT_869572 [Mycena albidolilacea]
MTDNGTLNWTGALHRTIMLAQLPHCLSNTRSSKYPSGDLWKCILGLSIIHDLEVATDDEKDTNTTRFIRLNHAGLSGVIFYPLPARRASIPDEHAIDSEVDALIEQNAVQVLYFPNLACTSFVASLLFVFWFHSSRPRMQTGQIMKSHLLSDSTICPKPHPSGSGYSLDSRAFEALGHALAGGSAIPIRDLPSELKPTPNCAEVVLKERRIAARLQLVIRYRNSIRNTPRDSIRHAPKASVPLAIPEDIKLDQMSLNARRDSDTKDEGPHNIPATPQSPPTLRPNVAIPAADKPALLPALCANTTVDHQTVEKKSPKVLEPAGGKGKENDMFV